VATMDDRDGGSLETTRIIPADGDDIVVIPANPDGPERPARVRPVWALVGLVAALLIVVGVAMLARRHETKSTIATTASTTLAPKAIVSTKPKKAIAPVTTAPPTVSVPAAVVTTVPHTNPAQTVVTSGTVAHNVAPPPTVPPPPKQYGAAALTWTAPPTLTIGSGKTAALAVTAHNGTDGTVTLPHPLSCTPRLDQSGVCTEMAQIIGSGQSASAQYTIDAHGIAPGHYTLTIEGVLTIAVTVT